jgi:LPS-assembly protein
VKDPATRVKYVSLFIGFVLALLLPGLRARAQAKPAAGRPVIELEADQQRKSGSVYTAEGHVVVRYGAMRLHADHVEYNEKTQLVRVRGHVRFDYRNQTIVSDGGWYNVKTGRALFTHVEGTIRALRRPNPTLLVSPNPLTFEARSIERLNAQTYVIHHAWLTVCDPRRPKWKFHTPRAVIRINRSVTMYGANFRLFSIPLLYMPYASIPAGRNLRKSGFLIPDIGQSTLKGFVVGDSYYWAPTNWLDMTLGGQYFSRRGWSQIANMRAAPAKNVHLEADYFGVNDRGIPGPDGTTIRQGGYTAHEQFDASFSNGWRLAADMNQLSSLQFRLAFAGTFSQAVNPEVGSSAFLTHNFDGYSLNFAAVNYKNFLTLQPEQAVVLRRAPEARFSSIDRPLFRHFPLYFGFDMFADAMHRLDTQTPDSATERSRLPTARSSIPASTGRQRS